MLERKRHGHVRLRRAKVVESAKRYLHLLAAAVNRVAGLRGEEERAESGVNDRAAGDFAVGGIGDLRLDARAEVAGVVVDAKRNPDLCLAVLIEPTVPSAVWLSPYQ